MVPRHFSILIKPAGPDCNARCDYCFYGRAAEHFTPGPHRMSDEVLRVLIRKMLALDLPVTQFAWQGGEPMLMGLEFFQRAVAYQMEFGRGGRRVSNALQTNGLLIDEAWAEFLAKYKFLLGVSLDGPADVHNRHRGEGSFQKVLAGTKVLERHGVEYNILATVNRTTQSQGRRIYQWFREQGFRYLQFIPIVETDEAGRPLPFAVTPEGYGEFMCEVFDAWRAEDGPGKVYVRCFESLLCHLAGQPAGNCILGDCCDHYLVIEHNGDVFPCDFFVRSDLRIGSILESDFDELADKPLRRAFAAAKAEFDPACRTCQLVSVCRNGCLKDRDRATGTLHGRTYLCPSYKILYPHILPWLRETADRIMRTLPPEPQRRLIRPATGRPARAPRPNDPCPCGSGAKFKRCCGRGRR